MIDKDDLIRKRYVDTRPVSVDISCTVYNHEKYLRQALDGMLMQKTDFPYRLLIHDDASTDDSMSIIHEYQEKYPDKIVVIAEKENLYQNGKSVLRKMLPYYNAKYIASCEGDDYWIDPYKLQKQVDYLEHNPDCVAVYHNILPVDKYGKHDEKTRGIYQVLTERDFSKDEIKNGKLKTQTASLTRWNYDPFLCKNDIDIFISTKCNGDVKRFILSGCIGRVHCMSDVMAAHRRVFDEGDSWTAKLQKKNKYEKQLHKQKSYLEICKLYEYLSGERINPYMGILDMRLSFFVREGRTLSDIGNDNIHIPFWNYALYIPHFLAKCTNIVVRKMVKRIAIK